MDHPHRLTKSDSLLKRQGGPSHQGSVEESESSQDGSTTGTLFPNRALISSRTSEMSWMSDASTFSEYQRPMDCGSLSSMDSAIGGVRQGSSALRSVTVSRLMGPSDANVYGNVHGGVILRMIDEAGTIMASRYCNNAPNKPPGQEACVAALARIEHMDFLMPMHITEVAELSAEVVYTHTHCLLVLVKVMAENIIMGEKRLTNKARLWYIPLELKAVDRILQVPLMTYLSRRSEEWGYDQYRRQKADRRAKLTQELSAPIHVMGAPSEAEPHTVSASQTCLSVIVGPNDVTFSGHCQGGILLKLMDECAGTTCCKHCRSICVTACIEATNFHKKIPKGALIFVHSWLTFTSKRSMEVEVAVEFETRWADPSGAMRQKAIDAFFTFVALDTETGRAKPVPQLKLVTEDEHTRFKQGEGRYHDMKKQRLLDHKHSCEVARLEQQFSTHFPKRCGCDDSTEQVKSRAPSKDTAFTPTPTTTSTDTAVAEKGTVAVEDTAGKDTEATISTVTSHDTIVAMVTATSPKTPPKSRGKAGPVKSTVETKMAARDTAKTTAAAAKRATSPQNIVNTRGRSPAKGSPTKGSPSKGSPKKTVDPKTVTAQATHSKDIAGSPKDSPARFY